MSLWTESLLVLLVLTNLWLLGGSRLANAIAAVAAQGILLAVLPPLRALAGPGRRASPAAGPGPPVHGAHRPVHDHRPQVGDRAGPGIPGHGKRHLLLR